MNTGNVTVKRTTNMLLDAYITNRKARRKGPEQVTRDLPVVVDRKMKMSLYVPPQNPWR
jgi:hypothetical protein